RGHLRVGGNPVWIAIANRPPTQPAQGNHAAEDEDHVAWWPRPLKDVDPLFRKELQAARMPGTCSRTVLEHVPGSWLVLAQVERKPFHRPEFLDCNDIIFAYCFGCDKMPRLQLDVLRSPDAQCDRATHSRLASD